MKHEHYSQSGCTPDHKIVESMTTVLNQFDENTATQQQLSSSRGVATAATVAAADALVSISSDEMPPTNPFKRTYQRDPLYESLVQRWFVTNNVDSDDDTKISNKRMRRSIAGIDFLAPTQSDESFLATHSVVRRLQQHNRVTLDALESQCKADFTSPQFKQGRRQFQLTALDQLLHQLFCAPIEQLCAPIAEARRWFLEPTRCHRYRSTVQHRDIDLFGNQMIDFARDMRIAFAPGAQLMPFVRLCAYARMSAFRFTDALTAEVLLVGATSTGKSYLLDVVAAMLVPGMSRQLTYATEKSALCDGNSDHVIELYHEASLEQLGFADRRAQGTSWRKALKTKKLVQVTSADVHDGRRVQRRHVWSSMMSTMTACNALPAHQLEPVLQRYIVVHLSDGVVARMHHQSEMTVERQRIIEKHQLIAFYCFLVEQAIGTHVMRDVDMEAFHHYSRLVLEAVDKLGYSNTEQAKLHDKLRVLARIATIEYAVCTALFSDVSSGGASAWNGTRFDEQQNWLHLLDIEPHLTCTKNIAIYVLSMCAFMFIDERRLALNRAICRLLFPTEDTFDERLTIYHNPRDRTQANTTSELSRDDSYVFLVNFDNNRLAVDRQSIVKKLHSLCAPSPISLDDVECLLGALRSVDIDHDADSSSSCEKRKALLQISIYDLLLQQHNIYDASGTQLSARSIRERLSSSSPTEQPLLAISFSHVTEFRTTRAVFEWACCRALQHVAQFRAVERYIVDFGVDATRHRNNDNNEAPMMTFVDAKDVLTLRRDVTCTQTLVNSHALVPSDAQYLTQFTTADSVQRSPTHSSPISAARNIKLDTELDLIVMRRRHQLCGIEPLDSLYPPIQHDSFATTTTTTTSMSELTAYPQCLVSELQQANEQDDQIEH